MERKYELALERIQELEEKYMDLKADYHLLEEDKKDLEKTIKMLLEDKTTYERIKNLWNQNS